MTKVPEKISILIVEDEAVLRRLLVTTLRGEGYTVYEASDGRMGREEALKQRPRLVLLDIIMPDMDGIAMLKSLREDEWGKTAKIVLLTNLDDVNDIERAKEFGVSDYLVKSDWSLEELAQQVREKLAS